MKTFAMDHFDTFAFVCSVLGFADARSNRFASRFQDRSINRQNQKSF